MYANEFEKQYTTLKEINLNETTQTEAQVNNTQQDGTLVSDVVLAFGTIGIIAIVAAACLMLSKIRILTKPHGFDIKRSSQVPCRNCRYFSGNFYLKCAIHPSVVLTKEATNCPDYSPANEQSDDS